MDYDKDNIGEYAGLSPDELAELQKLMHGYHPTDFIPASPPDMNGPAGMANMPNLPNAMNPAGMANMPGMPSAMNPAGMANMPGMPSAMNPAGMANVPGMPSAMNPANMADIPNVPANAVPDAPVRPGSGTPPDRTDDELQLFMEQGYLMGPNCFSRESQAYAGRLMEYINDEYRDHLTYTTLTRRAPTSAARNIFRNLAADELRHARQFASAYFLITGKRYFPDRRTVTAPPMPPYSQALRERYIAESRDAVKYRQFARETADRCLRRMAIDTSNDELHHAQQILSLIQRQY